MGGGKEKEGYACVGAAFLRKTYLKLVLRIKTPFDILIAVNLLYVQKNKRVRTSYFRPFL